MQSPVVSVSPITLSAPGRGAPLQVRASAPAAGGKLPILLFAHGFGSSMDAYAPLASHWAAHGFLVVQPTFLDSRTLLANPKADHAEAVAEYLKDPRKPLMWRYRIEDAKRVLDQLDAIEAAVPGLAGRADRSRVAAVGHSFGAQTAGALLGARVNGEDHADPRVSAGVLLSAAGRGGDALSDFAQEHFPQLGLDYAPMMTRTLVVAGDHDHSPLTTRGPAWFTDAYTLSPGADALVTLFGGEHLLGGISGALVRETTDENPGRVAAVRRLTTAYLQSALHPGDGAWPQARASLSPAVGRVDEKRS